MGIKILKKSQQVKGQFNGGAILENKPIGFPQERGQLQPYSNVFYWAHAWSDSGSLLDIHPHKGLEIISFVIRGEIEHFDSYNDKWFPLKAGDAQIIRSGMGISHAENFKPGSHIFQIWLDPNLEEALQKPASYNDYRSEDFPVVKENGFDVKVYSGENAPMHMESEGVTIKEYTLPAGDQTIILDTNNIYSCYLIDGEMEVNDTELIRDDFFKVEDENAVEMKVSKDTRLFVIESPSTLSYNTYKDLFARLAAG